MKLPFAWNPIERTKALVYPDTCLPNEICQSKQSAYSKEKEGHEKSA